MPTEGLSLRPFQVRFSGFGLNTIAGNESGASVLPLLESCCTPSFLKVVYISASCTVADRP